MPPVTALPPSQESPASVHHRKVFKKGQATARALNKPPWCTTLSHPPRPFPLGRGASRPLSSGVQAARRFACFSCTLPVSVGTFQGRQGFASPSGVARVLAFGCGPRQPPLRPLTPFPLENQKPRPPHRGQAYRQLFPAGRVFRAVAGRLYCRRRYPLPRRPKTR